MPIQHGRLLAEGGHVQGLHFFDDTQPGHQIRVRTVESQYGAYAQTPIHKRTIRVTERVMEGLASCEEFYRADEREVKLTTAIDLRASRKTFASNWSPLWTLQAQRHHSTERSPNTGNIPYRRERILHTSNNTFNNTPNTHVVKSGRT